MKINIKDIRISKGITQKEMAEKLGYRGKSGYCQLESGQTEMTISKAKKISKILDINPIIFFE